MNVEPWDIKWKGIRVGWCSCSDIELDDRHPLTFGGSTGISFVKGVCCHDKVLLLLSCVDVDLCLFVVDLWVMLRFMCIMCRQD